MQRFELDRNIGFGLVSVDCNVGDTVHIHTSGNVITGQLSAIPFTTT